MLNAAEAAMDATAEDDAERARIRAKLYAPPAGAGALRGARRPTRARRPATGSPGAGSTGGQDGMSRGRAQALMAQLAAEDARLAGRGNG